MENKTTPRVENLTPHTVNVIRPGGPTTEIPPAGPVPRVETHTVGGPQIAGVPTVTSWLGQVCDLPDQRPGVYLIVSQIVASACRDRDDLLYPYDLVRDEQGRPIGCRALAWAYHPMRCYKCYDTGTYAAGDMGGSPVFCDCPAGQSEMARKCRPCTCGSGEPWVSCHAGSPCCG